MSYALFVSVCAGQSWIPFLKLIVVRKAIMIEIFDNIKKKKKEKFCDYNMKINNNNNNNNNKG